MCAADRYRAAGVDIAAGDSAARLAMRIAARTHSVLRGRGAQLLEGVGGGFAAAVRTPPGAPVLLASADGVGTKVELARAEDAAETIGRDVVAMCVNDILCAGGTPLLFLDYYACGRLRADFAARVLEGIAAACIEAECALVGGETAEMPGVYEEGKMDVAGFAIGFAEEKDLLRPAEIAPGDVVIALASSGAHSNGYALINRILEKKKADGDDCTKWREELLKPTRLYCAAARELRKAGLRPKAMAHITGGGVVGNIARLLPEGVVVAVRADSFSRPPVFSFLREAGGIAEKEMWNVFNCGIGMAVFVSPEDESRALDVLRGAGENAWVLGVAEKKENSEGDGCVRICGISGL